MSKMQETDWRLERLFRAVALFDQLHVLEEAMQRFRKHEWVAHEFDCKEYAAQEQLLSAVLQEMGILQPGYVYKNIKMIQFWDLLRGAQVPEKTGLVLAFKQLDAFRPEYPEFVQELLQSTAREHYYQIKRGLRFMTCVHFANRNIKLESLMSIEASWNEQPSFSEEADKKWEDVKQQILNNPRRHRQKMD